MCKNLTLGLGILIFITPGVFEVSQYHSVEAREICIFQSDPSAIEKNLNTDLNVDETGLLHQKIFQLCYCLYYLAYKSC